MEDVSVCILEGHVETHLCVCVCVCVCVIERERESWMPDGKDGLEVYQFNVDVSN